MVKQPEDYTYIGVIYRVTKREARKLAKELGESPDESQMRLYQDSDSGKYYHD